MYNRKQIMDAINKINEINITVPKKALHEPKLYEIKKVLYDLMNINRYLFDPDYFYAFDKYKKDILCSDTKKQLDSDLNYCIVTIKSELNKILNTIDTCIWDEQKQEYIEAV